MEFFYYDLFGESILESHAKKTDQNWTFMRVVMARLEKERHGLTSQNYVITKKPTLCKVTIFFLFSFLVKNIDTDRRPIPHFSINQIISNGLEIAHGHTWSTNSLIPLP